MNAYNQKRIEKAIDTLNDLEEELLSCYVEEDRILRELCETEMFSDEQVQMDVRVNILNISICRLKDVRKLLDIVISSLKGDGNV